jgi:hypothetical protein
MSSRFASNKYRIAYPRYGATKANLGNLSPSQQITKPNTNVIFSIPPENQTCANTRARFIEAD